MKMPMPPHSDAGGSGDPGAPSADPAGGHGMLLTGKETLYLYHLPMFMSPHFYQAILEVRLTKPGSDPRALYLDDRKTTGTKMYGFNPDQEFVLPDLVSTDPQRPRVTEFSATLWRGHFESGHVHEKQGKPLLPDVTAQVARVVLLRKLDPPAHALPQLGYFLFGKGTELFLAHVITRPPDFDQVLGVTADSLPVNGEQLSQGTRVTFPGRANDVSQKIQEGESLIGQVHTPRGDTEATIKVTIRAGTEFYFETDDLNRRM